MTRNEIPFGRPDITDADRQAVLSVLDGPILTHGPRCRDFEAAFADFIGGGRALTTSSCMAALHLSYIHLGIGPGDEVIVPAQTHVATVHAVEWTGATPVFADCDPTTGNLTIETIEPLVTEHTKAIGLVHFAGIPCDMEPILALSKRLGIPLIEDAALAIGATYDGIHVGLHGDMGCFSFYPVKHLTSAEGGMFVSRHDDVLEDMSLLRAFGVDKRHDQRKRAGNYDAVKLGLNYRMSELQAALGVSQLQRVNQFLDARRNNFTSLRDQLDIDGIRVLDAQDSRARSSHYCLIAVLEGATQNTRDAVIDHLRSLGIGSSVYYPRPVPFMNFYQERYNPAPDAFPHATEISHSGIALPVGPHLKEGDVEQIAKGMHGAIKEILA